MTSIHQPSLAPGQGALGLSSSQPVLIPPRICFGLVALHLVLTFGGVIFLYHNFKMNNSPLTEIRDKQEPSYKALARMTVKGQPQPAAAGYLQWDMNNSVCQNINYYRNRWLTILQPGDYYIYSRVTFSKGNALQPLISRVSLRRNETAEEQVVMQASCSLDSSTSNTQMCTVTLGEVITLERGNQLGVWIQDLSLVSYEESTTTFGMYRLWDPCMTGCCTHIDR